MKVRTCLDHGSMLILILGGETLSSIVDLNMLHLKEVIRSRNRENLKRVVLKNPTCFGDGW